MDGRGDISLSVAQYDWICPRERFHRPTTITIVHHSVVRRTQFAFVVLFPIFAAAVSGGVL